MGRTHGQRIRGHVFVWVSAYAAIALHLGQRGSDPDVIEVSSYTASLAYSCLVSSRLPVHGQSGVFMSDLLQFCRHCQLKPANCRFFFSGVFVANMSSSQETDWVHADLPSFPTSKSGHKIQWQVWTGQKFGADAWLDYPATDNWAIETSFAHGKKEDVILTFEGHTWTVNFTTLSQVNIETLTRRAIRRVVIVAEASVQP